MTPPYLGIMANNRQSQLKSSRQRIRWRGEGDLNPRGINPIGLAIQRNGQTMRPPLIRLDQPAI